MRTLTEYGKKVKIKLLDVGKTQEWLIEEIKKNKPELYVDASVLRKIFTGEIKQSNITPVVNEILSLDTSPRQ